jgi:pyruvate/2-oxoglutarate dehydrogenase complex dihydrolipoamide dehydrogenase (E3) component
MHDYEAIVIGTGQAGPSLAARLAGAGMRVAVIERGKFGGTCVNTGCTPTKTLVASAFAARMVQRAAEYGIHLTGSSKVDIATVKARMDAVVQQSRSSLESWLTSITNVKVYRGHASFVGPRTVSVGAETITGERVFIDVGGRPSVPKLPGIDRVPYLTSDSMMELKGLPEHLLVVGGSYVGLEFAQMYRRFGSRVTVVELGSHLIGREDSDVSDAVREILAAEDIAIRVDAKCIALEDGENGSVRAHLDCRLGDPSVSATHVLLAVGRTPNTDGLGLEKAGVEVDARGFIKVDESLKTSAEGIYALGDCNGRGAFTHTAYNDYEIVADNLLNSTNRKVSDRITIYGLFIDPPLGRVGMTEADAHRTGRRILVGRRPMTRVARAREKGETQGFMKVLVDAHDLSIVGAAILGVGGDEAVHSVLDAMYAHLPYPAVQHGVRIHPTVSELIPTVLGDLSS